jgi:hypothetical protein
VNIVSPIPDEKPTAEPKFPKWNRDSHFGLAEAASVICVRERKSMGLMPRRTGLGSPVDNDGGIAPCSVANLPWAGFMNSTAPADLQRFWASIFGTPPDIRMDGHAPTLETSRLSHQALTTCAFGANVLEGV